MFNKIGLKIYALMMIHIFQLRGEKVKLWQNKGESFEHILMKALGYTMFIEKYPNLEIEKKVNLKYKPDIVMQKGKREFDFWGECGRNSVSKTAWLLKHTKIEEFVLFKIAFNANSLIKQIKKDIPPKYRQQNQIRLINFVKDIKPLTKGNIIENVPKDWYRIFEI